MPCVRKGAGASRIFCKGDGTGGDEDASFHFAEVNSLLQQLRLCAQNECHDIWSENDANVAGKKRSFASVKVTDRDVKKNLNLKAKKQANSSSVSGRAGRKVDGCGSSRSSGSRNGGGGWSGGQPSGAARWRPWTPAPPPCPARPDAFERHFGLWRPNVARSRLVLLRCHARHLKAKASTENLREVAPRREEEGEVASWVQVARGASSDSVAERERYLETQRCIWSKLRDAEGVAAARAEGGADVIVYPGESGSRNGGGRRRREKARAGDKDGAKTKGKAKRGGGGSGAGTGSANPRRRALLSSPPSSSRQVRERPAAVRCSVQAPPPPRHRHRHRSRTHALDTCCSSPG